METITILTSVSIILASRPVMRGEFTGTLLEISTYDTIFCPIIFYFFRYWACGRVLDTCYMSLGMSSPDKVYLVRFRPIESVRLHVSQENSMGCFGRISRKIRCILHDVTQIIEHTSLIGFQLFLLDASDESGYPLGDSKVIIGGSGFVVAS